MASSNKKSEDERRERKERRKDRFLPFFGKDRRSSKVVREADVLEIYVPPLKATTDRRNVAKDPNKPK